MKNEENVWTAVSGSVKSITTRWRNIEISRRVADDIEEADNVETE